MTRPRISANAGGTVALNARFYKAGQALDPYAIRQVDIYRQSVRDENLVESVIIPYPTDSAYPLPLERLSTGYYILNLDLFTVGTCNAVTDYATGIYYDVWKFIGSENDVGVCTGSDPNFDNESIWKSQCNKFYVTNDDWYIDDDLCSINLGFESLQTSFNQPERRYLEVGMMPLPLYDFNYQKVMPILPFLTGTITISTQNCEVMVDAAEISIGLRCGSYRSNPFVLRYMLDTTEFIKGTYRYKVTVTLPNSETRTSEYMYFTIK